MLAAAQTVTTRPIEPAMSASALDAKAARTRVILVLALLAVYVIWGSTYLAMRIAVTELPPLLMASLRFVAAGIVMLAIARYRGTPWPHARDWLRVLPIGTLLFLGGNGFVAIAQLSVTSGGAAVVCAMMPLWVGVLAVISGERPTRREWLSLVLGFVGVLVLMGGPSLAGEPLHVALVIFAPVCWALGSVLARRLPASVGGDPFMLPAMEMLTGGAVLAIVGSLRGERIPLDASADVWLALGYLWIFGSLVAFTAYNWLLRNARSTVATSYAYVNPIIAVLLGAAISAEPLGASTFVANAFIVVAVMLALHRPKPAVTV